MTDVWVVSLNEVESMSVKAVRGAGAAWGVAEDVARAARWMAARRLDWSAVLQRLLATGTVAGVLAPVLNVADLLAHAEPGETWRIDACTPVWALALLSDALHGRETTLDLRWASRLVRLRPDGSVSADDDLSGIAAVGARPIVVTAAAAMPPLPTTIAADARRSIVPRAAWAMLEGYAARTYVPATVESRTTGAGGGRVDAD